MALLSSSLLVYLGGLITTIFVCLFLFFKYAHSYWTRMNIPSLTPSFFYGTFKDTILQKSTLGEEVTKAYRDFKKKGHKFVGAYLFHAPIFIPIDLELIKKSLIMDFDHFVDRGTYCNEEDDPLSAHLFSLEGMKWKHLRQKLTPTFTSGKLKMMFQTLVDCTDGLKDCLDESVAKGEAIDIKSDLVKYTTDVIGSCAFGLDCNSFKNPNSEFIRLGVKIFNPEPFDRIKQFLAFVLPGVAKTFKMRINNKEVDHFYKKIVKETIEYREKNNVSRNDFMQLLIQLKNQGSIDEAPEVLDTKLTLNEVTAQAFLFFIAGFETSSTTMTFCLYELAKNVDVQERARQDIVQVLKKHDGKITYESVMAMHYMERVILETLRKHPPIMALQRVVTKDYEIPNTNVVLEKGTMVFYPTLGLQEDPEFYPEPEKFDPDRFTEEVKATRPDYTFLPFGDGPRNCIGLRFGMMQTKVGLCRLLMNYRFTLNDKTQEPMTLDTHSFIRSIKGGVWLNAQRINS